MANHYTFGIGQPHTEVTDDRPPVLFDETLQTLIQGDGTPIQVVMYDPDNGDIYAVLENGSQTLIPVSSSGKVAPWPEFGSGSTSVTNDSNVRFLLDSTTVATSAVVRQQDVSAASVTQLSIFNTFGVGTAGDASATDWSRLINFTGIEFWTNSLNAGGTAYAELSFATATGIITAPSGGTPTPNTSTFTVPGALVGQQPNRMVMPITLDSDVRSLFRFVKANNADTVSICYRLINSPMAWKFHGTGEDLITGSGAVAQLAFGNTTIYPADTDGILVQALGTGPVALEWSGAAPSATRGMTLQSGEARYIDLVGQNIVLSTLRFFVPSGGFVRAKALKKQ